MRVLGEGAKLFFTLSICFIVVAYTNGISAAIALAVVWFILLLTGL